MSQPWDRYVEDQYFWMEIRVDQNVPVWRKHVNTNSNATFNLVQESLREFLEAQFLAELISQIRRAYNFIIRV